MSVLVTRLDNMGDVLLAGPAIRAVAAAADVDILCGPAGAAAARLLPGVREVLVWDAPWSGFQPVPVDRRSVTELVETLGSRGYDQAAVLTSFHQSPLPTALILRMAEVAEVAAVSVDYPGALLDHRLPYEEDLHEVEQNLAVTAALGYTGDDHLDILVPAGGDRPDEPYVVLHPGASVPARGIPDRLADEAADRVAASGVHVVVTGTDAERATSTIDTASPNVSDRRGETSVSELAGLVAGADVVVVGNSGPAHLAAATGTPVVSIFAPVVPYGRWRPWGVPTVVLGNQDISCRSCRARTCPFPDQPCIGHVTGADVARAVHALRPSRVGAS